jgi:uncharacterized RDD family membrane protein YckC
MDSLDSSFFSQSSLTQEPPQPVAYAGFFRRFGGYLIDSIIFSIISGVAMQLVGMLMGDNITQVIMNSGFGPGSTTIPPELLTGFGDLFFVSFLTNFVLAWLYFAGFESSGMQATPGKRLFGMKVTDLDGDPVGFGTATGRFLGKMISGALLMIGYLMAAFTAKKQALHDMIAGTVIVLRN